MSLDGMGAVRAAARRSIAVPLSIPGLQATSYGGWPALGFAVALFLVAGPRACAGRWSAPSSS